MSKPTVEKVAYSHLYDMWTGLTAEQKRDYFKQLAPAEAEEFFQELNAEEESVLLRELPERERRLWLRALSPDDAADVIQEFPEEGQQKLIDMLDPATRNEVVALLAYKEDVAGGLMNTRYVRLRPDMTVAEALTYIRRQAVGHVETIYHVYVLDSEQRLVGVLSLRRIVQSDPNLRVSEIMRTNVVTVQEHADQELISRLFAEHNLLAIPVVDAEGRMKGIVTVDDIVDVVEEEATEDIQKMGGSEALGSPYLTIALTEMVRKRGGWLIVLFLGELLTANAMAYYEDEIAKAVVLAIFIPLIISSGGNAGSQASTLVVRAMALGEVRLRDWWRVMGREVIVGTALGLILGAAGFARVVLWDKAFHTYGEHAMLIGFTVGFSLVGIVLWGSLAGSFLPFILRKAGFDPASASTPFVATLVDVTGLVIYFSFAHLFLSGKLL